MLLGLVCFVLFRSMYEFIFVKKSYLDMKESRFSTEIFVTMLVIYIIVIIGYGLIYFILSFQGIVLAEYGELRRTTVIGSLFHSLYFSGATLLTIGYGDIIPLGLGRFVALTEALIGYILPTAFVMKLVQYRERSREK